MTDKLSALVCVTSLKNMLSKGYLSICTIENILDITHGIPNGEDMRLLRALHCVSFSDMPPELLRGLPLIIKRVLGSEDIDFPMEEYSDRLKHLL